MVNLQVLGVRRCRNGSFENNINGAFYYNLYCIDSFGTDAGRQGSWPGSYQRCSRDILGKEQGTFHGMNTG